MKITIELLEKWGSCYSRERHVDLSPLDIAHMEDIPAKDRLWVLLRNEIISEKKLRLLACDFAEYALSFVKNPDQRSIDAIAVSRKYANGNATLEELTAASDAAMYAAWAVMFTSSEAARYAAINAASAAMNAAMNAARAASDAMNAARAARAASDAMNAASAARAASAASAAAMFTSSAAASAAAMFTSSEAARYAAMNAASAASAAINAASDARDAATQHFLQLTIKILECEK